MARNQEVPLSLSTTAAVSAEGTKIEKQELIGKARAKLAQARGILTPRGFTTRKSGDVWKRDEDKRQATEIRAWAESLVDDILVAREIFVELWELRFALELSQEGADRRKILNVARYKRSTNHPELDFDDMKDLSEGKDAELSWDNRWLTIARRAIEENIASEKTNDTNIVKEELVAEAIARIEAWEQEHFAVQMDRKLYDQLTQEIIPELPI